MNLRYVLIYVQDTNVKILIEIYLLLNYKRLKFIKSYMKRQKE